MEAIGVLILIWIGWAVFKVIVDEVFKAGGKAVRKAQGKPEPFFGDFQLKIERVHVDEFDLDFVEIYGRGTIPIDGAGQIRITTTLLDIVKDDDGEVDKLPVISLLDNTQEEGSICFCQTVTGIDWAPGNSFVDWVPIAKFSPQLIQTAYKGTRKIRAVVAASLEEDPMVTQHGFVTDAGTLLQAAHYDIHVEIEESGYREERENRDKARELTISIGVAVAMSDGSLADEEGEAIKHWMLTNLDIYSEDAAEEMRSRFNKAFQSSFELAQQSALLLSPLCEELNEIGDKKARFDVIELCMEIMAADGIMAQEEMDIIHKIADAIDFDVDELRRIRDEKIVANDLSSDSTDAYTVLGIDSGASDAEKKALLMNEFQKWNDRLNSLEPGGERDNAQRMLNLVAELRKELS